MVAVLPGAVAVQAGRTGGGWQQAWRSNAHPPHGPNKYSNNSILVLARLELLAVESGHGQGADAVNIELMPGLTNVVRFPVEERRAPSMAVIYEIEPDVREVLRVGESFFLELPDPELANQVDAETARYIAEQVLPLTPAERGPALDDLQHPMVAAAVEACRHADRVGKRAVEAGERLAMAQAGGGQWLGVLEQAADGLVSQAAELLILAHQRCQEAHGVNRAVGMARRDEAWTPYSAAETSDWLAEAGRADQARKAARTA